MPNNLRKSFLFPFYKPQEGKWRVVGGAPMSIWLFIYLFKYRGRERTNTRRTTGEKKGVLLFIFEKNKKVGATLGHARARERGRTLFFLIFI
jgi:hypothetical protein